METDDKSTGQRTLEHEVDIGPTVLGDITSSDDTLFLQLLVGELVGTKLLVLLLFPRFALRLAPDVVQVRLVGLQLPHQIRIVVADSGENLLELLGLVQHLLLQRAKVHEFLLDFISEKAEFICAINDPHFLQLTQELHGADTLAHHHGIIPESGRRLGDAV